MELDIVGLNPKARTLVHYEPSLDALTWDKRESRYGKEFLLGKKYMFTEVFDCFPNRRTLIRSRSSTIIQRVATGLLERSISIDELMSEIRARVRERGPMIKNAISERYLLLQTI